MLRIGVSKYGPRMKILQAAKQLRTPIPPPPPPPPSMRMTKTKGRSTTEKSHTEELQEEIRHLTHTLESFKETVKSLSVTLTIMTQTMNMMAQQRFMKHLNSASSFYQQQQDHNFWQQHQQPQQQSKHRKKRKKNKPERIEISKPIQGQDHNNPTTPPPILNSKKHIIHPKPRAQRIDDESDDNTKAIPNLKVDLPKPIHLHPMRSKKGNVETLKEVLSNQNAVADRINKEEEAKEWYLETQREENERKSKLKNNPESGKKKLLLDETLNER